MNIPGFLPAKNALPGNLRSGQLVMARVLGSPEAGMYQLRIRSQVVQVRSDEPLTQGQFLRLRVLGPEGFERADTPARTAQSTTTPQRAQPVQGEAALALARFKLPLLPAFIEHLQLLARSDPAALEGGAFMLARGLLVGPELGAMIGLLVAGEGAPPLGAQLDGLVPDSLISRLSQLFSTGEAPSLATLQQALRLADQLADALAGQARQLLAGSRPLQALALLQGLIEQTAGQALPPGDLQQLSAILGAPSSAEALLPLAMQFLQDMPDTALARYLLGALASEGEGAALAALLEDGVLPEKESARLLGRLKALLGQLTAQTSELQQLARQLTESAGPRNVAELLAKLAQTDPSAAAQQLQGILLLASRKAQTRLGDALSGIERQLIEQLANLDRLQNAQDVVRSLQVRWQAQTLLPAMPDPGSIMLTVLDLPVTPGGPFRRGQFQLLMRRDKKGRLLQDEPRTLYIDVELTELGRVEVLGTVAAETAELRFFTQGAGQAQFLGERADTIREALSAFGLDASVQASARVRDAPSMALIQTGTQPADDVGGIDVLA